jgi:1,4-dihydroxy-2-naphthoate octaprenyltransferase
MRQGIAGVVPRLLRVQFTPIMIAPVTLGAAIAWKVGHWFNPPLFALALVGSVCLHLAANAIDDVYDYINGTDKIADGMFPPDAPGWKPVARGMISVGQAFALSYAFYLISLVIGLVLSLLVGWFALVVALPGILLSYFYTAPPLKLDYRGLGLGELSILISFGPIPALGVYYVMSGQVSALPFILGLPSGLLTTGILISHDLIFFDAYKQAEKKSITVVLGKSKATVLSTLLSAMAYVFLAMFIATGVAPTSTLLAFAVLPLFLKFADLRGGERSPSEYGSRTNIVFLHSVLFTLLMSVGFLLG